MTPSVSDEVDALSGNGLTVVLVAHTFTEEGSLDEPVEVIRIISARPATLVIFEG